MAIVWVLLLLLDVPSEAVCVEIGAGVPYESSYLQEHEKSRNEMARSQEHSRVNEIIQQHQGPMCAAYLSILQHKCVCGVRH